MKAADIGHVASRSECVQIAYILEWKTSHFLENASQVSYTSLDSGSV